MTGWKANSREKFFFFDKLKKVVKWDIFKVLEMRERDLKNR